MKDLMGTYSHAFIRVVSAAAPLPASGDHVDAR